MVEIRTAPWETHPCESVENHTPQPRRTQLHHVWPLGWGGPQRGEVRPLCGSDHDNVHVLLDRYERDGGEPPWEFRRQFNPYIRALAAEGWRRYQEAQR